MIVATTRWQYERSILCSFKYRLFKYKKTCNYLSLYFSVDIAIKGIRGKKEKPTKQHSR